MSKKKIKDRLKTLDGNNLAIKITESEFAEYQSLKKQYKELLAVNDKRKEEIKNLKYVLYEERELTLDLGKANLKIAKLERDISSHKNRFKFEIGELKKELSTLLAEKNALEIGRDEYKQECNLLKQALKNKNIAAIVEENEELKEKLKTFVIDDKWVHPEVLALKNHQFCAGMGKDCIDGTVECQQKECSVRDYPKLKQALVDIEEYCNNIKMSNLVYQVNETNPQRILDIINKAKEL